jgi:hypothetical protein
MKRASAQYSLICMIAWLPSASAQREPPPSIEEALPEEARKLVSDQRRQEEQARRDVEQRTRQSRERLLLELRALRERYIRDDDQERADAIGPLLCRLEKEHQETQLKEKNQVIANEIQRAVEAEIKKRPGQKRDEPEKTRRPSVAPPALEARGRVTDVAASGFIQLDRGTRHGLAKGHEIEVYRFTAKPEWIGRARLVDVGDERSVGIIVTSSGQEPARKGDWFTSARIRKQ